MTAWAIYARLSRDDDSGPSAVESCAVQLENARRFVAKQGGTDPLVFTDDGWSGATVERPGLTAMLEAARANRFRFLVVRDLDRLARDQLWQFWMLGELARARVEVWTYSDSKRVSTQGTDGVMTSLKAFAAETERTKCVERTRDGLRRRAELGLATGAAPIGYRNIRLENGTGDYAIDPDGKALVVDLARRFVRHKGVQSRVVRELQDAGIRTPHEKHWTVERVRRTLANPLYRGVRVHGRRGIIYEGGVKRWIKHPPESIIKFERPDLRILEPKLAAQVDRLLNAPRKRTWGGAAAPRWLSSCFVACSRCGSSICATAGTYRCRKHHQSGHHACEGVGSRPTAQVDAALVRTVLPLIDGDIASRTLLELRRRLDAEVRGDATEAERDRLRRELEKCRHQIESVTDAIATGKPPAALVTRLRALEQRESECRNELAGLDRAPVKRLDAQRTFEKARKRLGEFSALLARGGVEARPVLAALLGHGRFQAFPVKVRGKRLWELTARVGGGYLVAMAYNDDAQARDCRATRRAYVAGTSTSRTTRCTKSSEP